MKNPKNLEIDLEAKLGYVQYADAQIAGTIDVWHDGQVAADLDAHGDVVGIEVLSLDEATLSQAREYAASKGLAFPAHLEAVLVPA